MKLRKALMGLQVAGSRFLPVRKPLVVGWEVTNRCNLGCLYCAEWEKGARDIPFETSARIVEEIRRSGTAKLSFTGGEPLLAENIGKLMRLARNGGVHTVLTTNGSLLPDRLEDAAEAAEIVMSYDGPRQAHDGIRGEGTHESVMKAIDTCRTKLKAGLKLRCVISSYNVHLIPDILDFTRKNRLTICFSIIQNLPASARDLSALTPSREAVREGIETIIRSKKEGNPYIWASMPALKVMSRWPEDVVMPCAAGKLYCRIDAAGAVYSCGKSALTRGGKDCSGSSFEEAFRTLRPTGCGQCWCDSNIELNLIHSLCIPAIKERISEL